MQTKTILIDSVVTEYIVSDVFDIHKNVCVFLHGWGQDCNSFQTILDKMELGDMSFVSLSFPGF